MSPLSASEGLIRDDLCYADQGLMSGTVSVAPMFDSPKQIGTLPPSASSHGLAGSGANIELRVSYRAGRTLVTLKCVG